MNIYEETINYVTVAYKSIDGSWRKITARTPKEFRSNPVKRILFVCTYCI